MNYLLIMPRYRNSNDETYMFPLGIAYVSSSLKQVTDNVFTLNLNERYGDIKKIIKEAIFKYDINIVGTGGLSPNFNQIREIMDTVKEINPDIVTLAGGGMVTATPEVIMRGIKSLDIGMIGEGEYSIKDIADALANGKPLDNIEGIIFRNSQGEVIRTPSRDDIEDLDSLPFPDYDGFEYKPYNEVNICTSRSCPFNCTFCFHTCGKKYRSRSLDNIFEEIDWLVKNYAVEFIGILDELFSINLEKMEQFCNRIKKYNMKWSCQMRADRISLEILKKMKSSGCVSLSFGIENADNEILKSMEKKITIEKIEEALKLSKEAGITPFGNLLLGDKNDTKESFLKCYNWYKEHPEYQLGFNKILVLPGSKLYKYAVEEGYIEDEVKYLEEGKFAINITKMDDEEYIECLHMMDEAVMQREYLAHDIEVKAINVEGRVVEVKYKCPLCGKEISGGICDFTGSRNYSCICCGQNYNINLYYLYKEEIERKMNKILSENNKRIVVWGMGNEGLRLIYRSNFRENENLILVDKDVSKQGESIRDKIIMPVEYIEDKEIEYTLIGTSAPVTVAAIKRFIENNCPNIKNAMTIDEFFFKLICEE